MKSLRLMLCAMPLMLTGCSTMSSVNWSAANPWNWFGSSTKVSEQGVGELTASTPLQEQAIADALDGDYRLRSGMKTANGNVVRFFEVMKGDNVAMVINGDQGTISRIDVLDSDIPADTGVKIGTPFSDLYSKAFGNCQKADGDDNIDRHKGRRDFLCDMTGHKRFLLSHESGRSVLSLFPTHTEKPPEPERIPAEDIRL